MKYLLIVFFLYDGIWIQGDAAKGWGPLPYETEAACLLSRTRAENIHSDLKKVNPRAIDKRFECTAEKTQTND